MNLTLKIFRQANGFTLIEIIITIIVSAVAFAMVYSYSGSYITDSSVPIHRLSHALELKQVAERITEHYKQDVSADLNGLKDNVTNNPGDYGQNYTVSYNGFVKFSSRNDTAITGGDPETILKITIRHSSTNEPITMMFVRQ